MFSCFQKFFGLGIITAFKEAKQAFKIHWKRLYPKMMLKN